MSIFNFARGPQFDRSSPTMFAPEPPAPVKPSRVAEVEVPPENAEPLNKQLLEDLKELFPNYATPHRIADANKNKRHLALVLKELGIRPFIKAEVERYKAEQLGIAESKITEKYQTVSWQLKNMAGWKQFSPGFGGYAGREYDLTYTSAIPEFALHTAVQVKKALPECEIFIDELVIGRVPEPFLVVKYGDTMEWLEVWDEPTFKGQREA